MKSTSPDFHGGSSIRPWVCLYIVYPEENEIELGIDGLPTGIDSLSTEIDGLPTERALANPSLKNLSMRVLGTFAAKKK